MSRCMMKKTASTPRCAQPRPSIPQCQPLCWYLLPSRMATSVQSITRSEIDQFWRRKELEEEEQQLATEKEAARIKAKTLQIEDYMLFEQRIKEIIDEGNEQDEPSEGNIIKNGTKDAVVTKNIETWIGVKHWWKESCYAYLNEPAITSIDENNTCKITYIPQVIRFGLWSPAPYQTNITAFRIF